MARRETAARRYAEAAFQLAMAARDTDGWQRDLERLRDALAESELRTVVEHPAIPFRAKERVLRAAIRGVGDEPLRLVLLMIRRGRPGAIDAMLGHFTELVRRHRGEVLAQVRTALPLDEPQRAAVSERLAQITGNQVEMNEEVDESLIGGIAVRIGDTLYDASIRSRLERLRRRLTAV